VKDDIATKVRNDFRKVVRAAFAGPEAVAALKKEQAEERAERALAAQLQKARCANAKRALKNRLIELRNSRNANNDKTN
jgi:hypothetical protein